MGKTRGIEDFEPKDDKWIWKQDNPNDGFTQCFSCLVKYQDNPKIRQIIQDEYLKVLRGEIDEDNKIFPNFKGEQITSYWNENEKWTKDGNLVALSLSHFFAVVITSITYTDFKKHYNAEGEDIHKPIIRYAVLIPMYYGFVFLSSTAAQIYYYKARGLFSRSTLTIPDNRGAIVMTVAAIILPCLTFIKGFERTAFIGLGFLEFVALPASWFGAELFWPENLLYFQESFPQCFLAKSNWTKEIVKRSLRPDKNSHDFFWDNITELTFQALLAGIFSMVYSLFTDDYDEPFANNEVAETIVIPMALAYFVVLVYYIATIFVPNSKRPPIFNLNAISRAVFIAYIMQCAELTPTIKVLTGYIAGIVSIITKLALDFAAKEPCGRKYPGIAENNV